MAGLNHQAHGELDLRIRCAPLPKSVRFFQIIPIKMNKRSRLRKRRDTSFAEGHNSGMSTTFQNIVQSSRQLDDNRRPTLCCLTGIALNSNSHIFIPGDIPFIPFLLPELGEAVGPCAPTPSTSRDTCTLPAFSNSKVIGSLSPFLSGPFKSIIIK
jgi:hypothetical protein